MPQPQTFTIENLDPLAQGVSRDKSTTTFIAKTLPGEVVTATVKKQKKNSQFAKLDAIETPSEKRIEPECPHFNECSGCHYLHMPYADEVAAKLEALNFYCRKLNTPEIQVFEAPRRLGYRNRVQLHHRFKYLGLIDGLDNQVLEVPECKIFAPELQESFDALYEKDWFDAFSKDEKKQQGHVELYLKDGQVKETWNQAYANEGFTQVNHAMNEVLKNQLSTLAQPFLNNDTVLLDLFSGTGNLSNHLMQSLSVSPQRLMVDIQKGFTHADFNQINLFDNDALERFTRKTRLKQCDVLLIDPPRAGFAQLNEWVLKLKPKYLLYVSCNPVTFARDVSQLNSTYTIKSLSMLDLFPATHHFETMSLIHFKKHPKNKKA